MSAEAEIRSYAERIVRLEMERRELASDIKDVKAEAKGKGFNVKLIATCVRLMLLEADKQAAAISEHEELDLYLGAVGLLTRADEGEAEETRRDAGGRGEADYPAASVRTDIPEQDKRESAYENQGAVAASGAGGGDSVNTVSSREAPPANIAEGSPRQSFASSTRDAANRPPLDPTSKLFPILFKARHGRDPEPADYVEAA